MNQQDILESSRPLLKVPEGYASDESHRHRQPRGANCKKTRYVDRKQGTNYEVQQDILKESIQTQGFSRQPFQGEEAFS